MKLRLFFALIAFAAAIEPGANPAPSQEMKLKPQLCQPDGLLLVETFAASSAKWHAGHGDWTFVDGHARGAERAADHHGADLGHSQLYRDAIFQLVFKFEGSHTIDVNFVKNDAGGKCEHVGRVTFTPTALKLLAQTDIGPTTKNIPLVEKPASLADDRWHTALIEIMGDEIAVQLDGGETGRARHEIFAVDKTGVTLATNGVAAAFDELSCWKAARKEEAK